MHMHMHVYIVIMKLAEALTALCAADAELVLGMFNAFEQQVLQVLWVISERYQQLLAAQGWRLPPHVHATSFAPQNSVRGHPNTIAFVTQGGTNSVQEVHQASTRAYSI